MKYLLTRLLLVSALGTLFNTTAQTNAIGSISTEIVSLITAEESAFLNFGKISALTSEGKVQITPQGERITNGDVLVVNDDYSVGTFVIKGAKNSVISVILPQTSQKLTSTQGSYDVLVEQWACNTPQEGIVVNEDDGKIEVNIGATLRINNADNSPTGLYTGSYQVTFTYN